MSRSPATEGRWLRDVVNTAAGDIDADDFFHAVTARLAKGASEYGDEAFLDRSFTELVEEAIEEGADLPGWLVLAIQRFELERDDFDPALAAHVERTLTVAAAKAFEAWYILRMALELYEEAPRRTAAIPARPPTQFYEE